MSARGRVLSLIGVRDEAMRFVPPEPVRRDEDDPQRHQLHGNVWLVGAAELYPAVVEVRAELADVEAPSGFRWLDFPSVQAIVHDLAMRRPDADMPVPVLRYRADGRLLPDDPFGEHVEALLDGTYVTVSPTQWQPTYPSYSPREPSSRVRADNEATIRACQVADARELACWMVGPVENWHGGKVRRCWRVGTPFPPELDGGAEPQLLAPDVVRRITREVRTHVERGGPRLPDVAARLVFDVSPEGGGECSGPWFPNSERLWGRPPSSFLTVRLPLRPDGRLDDTPERLEELEGLVARVRVAADGTVILPTPDPVNGAADAF